MKQLRRIFVVLLIIAAASGCARAQQITVAAAADLKYALTEIADQFQKTSGIKVALTFGASGNFFSQIQNGAPFDLFFSADEEYPKKLAELGFVEAKWLHTYAIGHVVLWVPASSALDPQKLQIELLTQEAVKRIAIANPQHAPYGRAAMSALDHYGLKKKVADKLVFGESVSQAAQFVQSGNAQAGLIALSLAKSPSMESAGKYWELPSDSYPELKQGVAIISSSKQKEAAQKFLDFVLSPAGVAVLTKYGLTPPVLP